MKRLLKHFSFWLNGIEEDTPLPYEIKHLYFNFHRINKYISFGGNQFANKRAFNFEYSPLEAQFFNVEKYDRNFSVLKLRTLVENLLDDSFFYKLFLNKNIYISYFGENYRFNFINS